ncbi:MAG: tetratricopeptide repeat protein [Campylobacteraceae bacterium]|nr:tetratricopeptide repeat protein [Campylobacteraceae bacterium]
MDTLFLEYRDPIFGVIIFFAIVFVIAFVNYWWGIFKGKEERYSIEQFIKRFEVMANANEYKKLFDEFSISSESLGLLAHSYSKSGEYEKSIGIYLIALKRVKNKEEKQYFLFELGKIYFKAGFLRRGADIFLELLKLYPRHKEALKILMVIYEQLKEYDKALEVMDSLEELDVEVKSEKNFVKALQVLNDVLKTNQKKYEILSELTKKEPLIGRILFEFAKKELLDFDVDLVKAENILDLLWESDILLLKNSSQPLIRAIVAAKTGSEMPQDMSFELEVLAILKKQNYTKATVGFEYTCTQCKNTFPVYFYRCPSCYTLKSPRISLLLIKNEHEEYYTF